MNVAAFLDCYQDRFHEQLTASQSQGLELLLGMIAADPNLRDIRWIAYLLATVKWECRNTWHPIKEQGRSDYFVQRYWNNKKVCEQLGNLSPEDAARFCGRGYVQITGRFNYRTFSGLTGVDLMTAPERALEPSLAYQIASIGMRHGKFTGKSFAHYINEQGCDYFNARRIINGTARAALIATYALTLQQCIMVE